jgi:type I restriction enzyme S subunit
LEVFLRLLLESSSQRILSVVTKSTHGTRKLETEVYENFVIPIPRLAEQAAIVERVEALMTTCRALEAEIEHARTHAAHLLQAVLKEAFAPASA